MVLFCSAFCQGDYNLFSVNPPTGSL